MAKYSNSKLDAREAKTIGKANVYIMDWVCEGWGELPPRVAYLNNLPRHLTNAEKREVIAFFEANAPGDY